MVEEKKGENSQETSQTNTNAQDSQQTTSQEGSSGQEQAAESKQQTKDTTESQQTNPQTESGAAQGQDSSSTADQASATVGGTQEKQSQGGSVLGEENTESEKASCPMITKCSFLMAYEEKEETKMAIRGFKQKYCNGSYSDCKRYKLGDKLGHDKVPNNMMPNGMPITNTSDKEWSEQIKQELMNH